MTEPDTAACGDHKVFPRDTFARTRRAEVWCDKPKGHDGEHQAVKGSTAFVWEDPMASDSAATDHTVEWWVDEHGCAEPVITCEAPDGALCRRICPEGCEEWDADHEHPLVPAEGCNALTFFENADEPGDSYDGGHHRIENGPVEIEWQGDCYVWRYPR